MKKILIISIIGGLGIFAVGYWMGQIADGGTYNGEAVAHEKADFWTCSMHPQIQSPKLGPCPLCGMDLVPVIKGAGSQGLGMRQIQLSPSALRLAQVELAPVRRFFPTMDVRMSGKVEYDETRLAYITARVPGRLDRLYVDYTGVPVQKGDHLVSLYSPDLLTSQEELLQAVATASKLEKSRLSLIRERAAATIVSARERLRLWGLTTDQVAEIERSGKTSDHLTIYAPVSGIVVHMDALEGIYVQTGSRIYTIADLSQVWVKLDAYESDLAWIHYGQEVAFETEAYPGETFSGRIAFIDPVLDPKTRTVKVRVNVPNTDGRLKPEMFVRAVVRSQVADQGKVIDPGLAGKWISPMHPEIVKDGPGTCDICGMDLVKAEDLGFILPDVSTNRAPLIIPASAPLITGKRAVVYVAMTNQPGLFEGREIVLGQRAGDVYVVREGLTNGELVVVHGNFKIDSAIQIQAGPSMMNPLGGGSLPGHGHEDGHRHSVKPVQPGTSLSNPGMEPLEAFPEVTGMFREQLNGVLGHYLELQDALSHDRFDNSFAAVTNLQSSLDAVDMNLLQGQAHQAWMARLQQIRSGMSSLAKARGIKEARLAFAPLSEGLIAAARQFGAGSGGELFLYHCPMALSGQGANWLQNKPGTENPYYGSEMFSCGEVTARWKEGEFPSITP